METPPYHVSACCCLADNGHSALDGTGHHAADNVLLAGEVEDDDGQNADHNQRHHRKYRNCKRFLHVKTPPVVF